MRWTSGRMITFGAVVLLSILGGRLVYSVWALRNLDDYGRGVDRLQSAMEAVLSVHAGLCHVEATERAFLLNNEPAEGEEFEADVARLRGDLDRLDREVVPLPGRAFEVGAIRRMVDVRIELMRGRIALAKAGRLDEARKRFLAGGDEDAASHALATVIQVEKAQRDQIQKGQEDVARTFSLTLLVECFGTALRALVTVVGAVALHLLIRSQQVSRRVIERQRKMFEATLMSLGDGMIATDRDGRITVLNDAAAELIGTSRGESIGAAIGQVFRTYNKPDGSPVSCASQKVLESESGSDRVSDEAFLGLGDGPDDFRPLSLTAARIRDDEGNTSGSVLVFRDITPIRRYQAELSQSEARFRQLSDGLPISMFVMRRDQSIEYMNHSAMEYIGNPSETIEAIGWASLVHPDDLGPVLERLHDAIGDPEMKPAEAECRFLRRDGVYRWFLVRMAPLDLDEHGPLTWLGTAIDIHDRLHAEKRLVQSEERLRLAIEAGQVLPWENDVVAGVFRADPIFYELHGFPEGQAPSSLAGWVAFFHPDDSAAYIRAIQQHLAGETDLFVFDYRVPRADGSVLWFEVRGWARERDASGLPLRLCGTTIDITRQKLAQIEANTLLARLQAIYRASEGVAMVAVGKDGRITDFNSGAEAMLGYPAEEVIGRLTPLAFHDPADCARIGAEMAATMGVEAHGGEVIYEYLSRFGVLDREWLWVRKDGSRLVVDLVHTLLRDADGRVIGCLGIARDVTDRKRVESELRQSEERFRILAEALPHQTWVMRPDLTFEYMNNLTVDFTGVTAEEMGTEGYYRLMHLEDIARVAAEVAPLHHAGRPYELEFRLRNRQGEYRWMLSRTVPLKDAAGSVTRWIGTTTDIHERWTARAELEASEKRFQDAAEALNGYIYEADFVRDFTSLSKGFQSLLGHDLAEKASISEWSQLIHPDDRGRIHEEIRGHASQRRRRGQYEYRLRHRDGHYLDVWDSAVHHYDEAGTITRAVGHVIDVSDRKRFAQALQEADRRKDNFLATLSHELRNPLAPIRSAVQAMRLTLDDREALRSNLAIVDRQLAQMVRLVDDLLDVTRISRGKVHLRKEPVELGGLLRRAIETCQPHLRAAGHRIAFESPDQPIWVEADPIRLEQVFANLIHNACKYTGAGGAIALRVGRQAGDAVVSLLDNGIGIAPDQLGRIFEMFSQADQAIDRSQGGLGVGLSLVRSLVELHGGEVEARSQGLGRGSEFLVRLPASDAAPAAVAPSAPVLPESQPGAGNPPDRILVVDDNKDAANMMATVLQLYGHEVEVAYDGEAGLHSADAFRPTAVILDIGMPRLNGYDACRALRALPAGRDALLIAVTGWGQEEDRERSRHAGFDHHLVKPVEIRTLLELLAQPRPARV